LGVMHQWHAEGRTIIAVIHDHQQVAQHFPHTLLLARELITWGKSAEVLQAHHLNRARHMSEAWNEQAPVCHQ
jgi:zinc/manganese transport system ATP-binding protein